MNTRVKFVGSVVAVLLLVSGATVAQDSRMDRDDVSAKAGRSADLYSIYWPDDFGVALERIDTRTGQGTHVWRFDVPVDPGFPGPAYFVTPFGIAFDVDGSMYTIINWLDFDPDNPYSRFARVDKLTGAVSFIGKPYQKHFAAPEMDDCGNLYATGFTVGDPAGGDPLVFGDSYLYRINKVTGEATQVMDTGRTDWMDLAFDSQGRLWATTRNALWRFDIENAQVEWVTDITGVPMEDIPGVCAEDWPFMEVMTIAFDKKDRLWATAMRGFSVCPYEDATGIVMVVDVETGVATVVGNTGLPYNHGGDVMPARVTVCHRRGNGSYNEITISLNALPAHLAHGDVLPADGDEECSCPGPARSAATASR